MLRQGWNRVGSRTICHRISLSFSFTGATCCSIAVCCSVAQLWVSSSIALAATGRCLGSTHPPRKAPTGFLTGGAATVSCNNGDDVLNDLERKGEGALIVRPAEASLGRKARDAITAGVEGGGCSVAEDCAEEQIGSRRGLECLGLNCANYGKLSRKQSHVICKSGSSNLGSARIGSLSLGMFV